MTFVKISGGSLKKILSLLSISIFMLNTSYAQQDSIYNHQLGIARAEFTKSPVERNYKVALLALAEAEQINRTDPFLYYLLSYTYDGINASDGRGVIGYNMNITKLAVQAMEKCYILDPEFPAKLMLNPKDKINSLWSAMALKYEALGYRDSAQYCYRQTLKNNYRESLMADFLKLYMKQLPKNAIVLSAGDMVTYNLYFLQNYKGYRMDARILDVNMINTPWYADYAIKDGKLKSTLSSEEIKQLKTIDWESQPITVDGFFWYVPKSSVDGLIPGDQILLDIIQQEAWDKPFHFTPGFNTAASLGLIPVGKPEAFGNSFQFPAEKEIAKRRILKELKEYLCVLNCYKDLNDTDLRTLRMFRFYGLARVDHFINSGEIGLAKSYLELLYTKLSPEQYPFSQKGIKNYADGIKAKIDVMIVEPEAP